MQIKADNTISLALLVILIVRFGPHSCFILCLAIEGTIMTISKDRVKPSPMPDSWKLKEIFATGIVLGSYLALMTVLFFWAMKSTNFFKVSVVIPFSCTRKMSRAISLIMSLFCSGYCY